MRRASRSAVLESTRRWAAPQEHGPVKSETPHPSLSPLRGARANGPGEVERSGRFRSRAVGSKDDPGIRPIVRPRPAAAGRGRGEGSARVLRFEAFAALAVLAAACAGAPARPAGSAAAPESEAWVGGAVEPAPPPPAGTGTKESGADGAQPPAVLAGDAGAKPGSATAPPAVPAPAAERPFPGRVASVAFEVRVKPPGQAEIAGFVRDRDGNPVERACVELTGAGGAARSPVFTSGQGNFRFTAVPAGLVRVTMTVEDLGAVSGSEISDYHTHDPRLTVMLRPLVLAPADGRIEVLRIKREGDLGQGDGTRWIEVAPLALRLEGYSSACREALRPAPPRPPPRASGGRRSRAR